MKINFLVVAGLVVAAVAGLYLFNTRVIGSADVLSSDPAYTDASSIGQTLDATDSAVDSSVADDLSANDADLTVF